MKVRKHVIMSLKVLKGIGLSVVLAGFVSCSTDVDINAPYETTAVVYGFVEPVQDTQFVKINRTYLGDGNNAEYAAINDSTMFSSVNGTVDKIMKGTVQESYDLQEMWVTDLEDGIFYTDSQKVFYWIPAGGIDDEATYEINLDINEGEKIVSAVTEVVGFVNFKQTFRNKVVNTNGVALANTSTVGENVYNDLGIEWGAATNGKRYQVKLVFNYEEHTTADTTMRSISTTLGSIVGQTSDVDFFQNYNGENFYVFVANRLQNDPNEASIVKRVAHGLEFHIVVADENLHTYMEVNEPASGIVSERPIFTNISNGYGLFASRNTTILDERNIAGDPIFLSLNSERELVFGQYTQDLKFCSKYFPLDPVIGCQ
ncbi:MAG: DUF4249 family protein [Flavobacteriales bacterium]|nr:DUF4249 family protein [Flavobacteriales bacterium]MCB9198331.1 DUF4249 family protein [Flavobacteriales bacterium]